MPKERHVMELQGRTRVVVENGKVIEVGVPMTEYCPIFDKVRGIKKFTPKTAKDNIEFRMKDFGMFSENRELEMEIFVGFGASETFMTALRRGLLDTTITVCDGAGTVITGNPRLCQGGVVIDPRTAAIDQVSGVRKAIELGFRKIGVSVANLKDLKEIRRIEKETGTQVIAFGVHSTGMPDNEAKEFIDLVDMATGCTSKWIRAGVAGKTIAQFGTAVPIFAITTRGRELLLERAKEVKDPILVNTMKLPVLPEERQPGPLV
ncbi:MAG: hypothetical protein C3F06_13880 [Candidatus Methanoperedenaceae archaeon]|nr:MAG: hypothetical protein C3F06_13880 [Candidatus Methanoperedenaceae archaeon]